MNISTKCNCCVCEPVCKFKEIYENGVKSILDTIITDQKGGFWVLKNCPHVEMSIRCPHMVTKTRCDIKDYPSYLDRPKGEDDNG